jgi:DNA-binding response OmpR family regulator
MERREFSHGRNDSSQASAQKCCVSRRVVIVSSDPEIRHLLAAALTLEGLDVTMAADDAGITATPDVVLLAGPFDPAELIRTVRELSH